MAYFDMQRYEIVQQERNSADTIYTEVFIAREQKEMLSATHSTKTLKGNAKLVSLLRESVEMASNEKGWAQLSAVGTNIAKKTPDFDPKNYGCTKLGELIEATELFDINKTKSIDNNTIITYIRNQRKKVENESKKRDFACTVQQWKQFKQRYAEGDTCNGTIESVVWMGLFIAVTDSGVTGLLHKSNLPEDFMTCFTVGQKISVTIKVISSEKQQIELERAVQNLQESENLRNANHAL